MSSPFYFLTSFNLFHLGKLRRSFQVSYEKSVFYLKRDRYQILLC